MVLYGYEIALKICWVQFENDSRCARTLTICAKAIFLWIIEIWHENEDFWLFQSPYDKNRSQDGLVGICAVLYGYEIALQTCWVQFENDSKCARTPTVHAKAIFGWIMEISQENEDFWLFQSSYDKNRSQDDLVGVCTVLYGYEIALKTCWVQFENDSRCARTPTVRAKAIFLWIMEISHENEDFWLFQSPYDKNRSQDGLVGVCAVLYD